MRSRQRGIGVVGLIAVAAVAALLGFAALQLLPVYLEYFKVRQVLADVRNEHNNQSPTITSIRKSLGKRINVEDIKSIDARDFEITKISNGYQVRIVYEATANYIANVSFLVLFDEAVEINK